MGKNNQARRAAKAKQRHRTSGGAGPVGSPTGFESLRSGLDERTQTEWEFDELMQAAYRMPRLIPHRAGALAGRPQHYVDELAERALIDIVGQLWPNGWQPAELRRHAKAKATAASARLIELAILAEEDRSDNRSLDPRWAGQLQRLGQRSVSLRGGWLAGWRLREGLAATRALIAVAEAIALLVKLPRLEVLIPPPGRGPESVRIAAPSRGDQADPVVERIRKLLAKAESTEFADEAATFTAKAQELMTRHAVDEALLSGGPREDGPRMIRIPVDAPYADAKSLLVLNVAQANRCKSVFYATLDLSAVLGFSDDLALVELLVTSLLVQAQHALAETARALPGGRARQQSFRSSFFVAYAQRIGDRLTAANREVIDETERAGRGAALPVLRARSQAVDDAFDRQYGDTLASGRIRGGYDPAGRAYGTEAADRAKLSAAELAG